MINKEDIIKGLECAIGVRGVKNCNDCPYDNDFNCIGCDTVMRDAITALKEHEKEVQHLNNLIQNREKIIDTYHKADGFLAAHGWRWETNE